MLKLFSTLPTFTEGFDTADPKDAKALLDELSA
jgi:hypothetical protein